MLQQLATRFSFGFSFGFSFALPYCSIAAPVAALFKLLVQIFRLRAGNL
jgi:hypothetical protein